VAKFFFGLLTFQANLTGAARRESNESSSLIRADDRSDRDVETPWTRFRDGIVGADRGAAHPMKGQIGVRADAPMRCDAIAGNTTATGYGRAPACRLRKPSRC
jgi:hypothetical protein